MRVIPMAKVSLTLESAMRFSDLTFVVLIALAGTASGQSLEDVTRIAQGVFGEACVVTPLKLTLSADDLAALNSAAGKHPWKKVRVYDVQQGNTRAGYCAVDNVKGKARPITYLVAFDTAGVIMTLEVLKYRESHGGEVRSSLFREQFAGKSHNDPLRIGKDIRNVSGATISSRSLTRGARALANYIAWLQEAGRL
ncbi:MAG: FMN-binding protein [Ignavibacteria bacterium]|nr:MAG: FMN-binding protein [Ignavibacteria bacterium]